MPQFFRILLYGVGAFVLFTSLAVILKIVTNHVPTEDEYYGLFTTNDLMLGLVVAVVVTFTHYQKKKLKG